MYKSQLQEFAQKAGFTPPLYEFVKEGPSHEPRFKSMVTVNSVTYESNLVFPNLKSAEHAAAKVALNALFPAYGVAPSPVVSLLLLEVMIEVLCDVFSRCLPSIDQVQKLR